jgi:oligoendopeptidase F
MELRGYKTVMSKRNISEQLPDEVVDTLMSEVQKFYPLYQRFLRAKQKHLQKNAPLTRGVGSENENGGLGEDENYEKFYGYDVHAPIFKIEKKIPYEEACKTVIEMFEGFDSRFGNYARDMLASGRVDAFPKAGKRGGAFASYDKVTREFRPPQLYRHRRWQLYPRAWTRTCYPRSPRTSPEIPCLRCSSRPRGDCEYFLRISPDGENPGDTLPWRKTRTLESKTPRCLWFYSSSNHVCQLSSDASTNISTQAVRWPTKNSISGGTKNQRNSAGDVITPILPPEKNYTWSAIPHIFSTPFYCYAYSFGMLVSLALVEKYKSEGTAMIEDYVRLLSSGGSVPPVEILQSIGIDVTKPEFYSDAFATIEEWLVSFEETQMKND